MSKGKLPDSLDLLLDTMCNTFGGVVFIAISLSLAFFVSKDQLSQVDKQEKIKEELKKEQQLEYELTADKQRLNKKLSMLKNISAQYKNTKTGISEEVTELQQKLKNLKRDCDTVTADAALAKHQKNNIQTEIDSLEKSIKEKSKLAAQTKQLLQEKQQLELKIDDLREQLKNVSVTRLHFAHNKRINSFPYVILLHNNYLYRLGQDYFSSSSDVNVTKDNDILYLSPKKGTLLSAVSEYNLSNILHDYNRQNLFLFIVVHPNSFKNFVKFRRILRQTGYPVHWHISHNTILYLGEKTDYSASY